MRTLTPENKESVKSILEEVISIGIDFKTKTSVKDSHLVISEQAKNIVTALRDDGESFLEILDDCN